MQTYTNNANNSFNKLGSSQSVISKNGSILSYTQNNDYNSHAPPSANLDPSDNSRRLSDNTQLLISAASIVSQEKTIIAPPNSANNSLTEENQNTMHPQLNTSSLSNAICNQMPSLDSSRFVPSIVPGIASTPYPQTQQQQYSVKGNSIYQLPTINYGHSDNSPLHRTQLVPPHYTISTSKSNNIPRQPSLNENNNSPTSALPTAVPILNNAENSRYTTPTSNPTSSSDSNSNSIIPLYKGKEFIFTNTTPNNITSTNYQSSYKTCGKIKTKLKNEGSVSSIESLPNASNNLTPTDEKNPKISIGVLSPKSIQNNTDQSGAGERNDSIQDSNNNSFNTSLNSNIKMNDLISINDIEESIELIKNLNSVIPPVGSLVKPIRDNSPIEPVVIDYSVIIDSGTRNRNKDLNKLINDVNEGYLKAETLCKYNTTEFVSVKLCEVVQLKEEFLLMLETYNVKEDDSHNKILDLFVGLDNETYKKLFEIIEYVNTAFSISVALKYRLEELGYDLNKNSNLNQNSLKDNCAINSGSLKVHNLLNHSTNTSTNIEKLNDKQYSQTSYESPKGSVSEEPHCVMNNATNSFTNLPANPISQQTSNTSISSNSASVVEISNKVTPTTSTNPNMESDKPSSVQNIKNDRSLPNPALLECVGTKRSNSITLSQLSRSGKRSISKNSILGQSENLFQNGKYVTRDPKSTQVSNINSIINKDEKDNGLNLLSNNLPSDIQQPTPIPPQLPQYQRIVQQQQPQPPQPHPQPHPQPSQQQKQLYFQGQPQHPSQVQYPPPMYHQTQHIPQNMYAQSRLHVVQQPQPQLPQQLPVHPHPHLNMQGQNQHLFQGTSRLSFQGQPQSQFNTQHHIHQNPLPLQQNQIMYPNQLISSNIQHGSIQDPNLSQSQIQFQVQQFNQQGIPFQNGSIPRVIPKNIRNIEHLLQNQNTNVNITNDLKKQLTLKNKSKNKVLKPPRKKSTSLKKDSNEKIGPKKEEKPLFFAVPFATVQKTETHNTIDITRLICSSFIINSYKTKEDGSIINFFPTRLFDGEKDFGTPNNAYPSDTYLQRVKSGIAKTVELPSSFQGFRTGKIDHLLNNEKEDDPPSAYERPKPPLKLPHKGEFEKATEPSLPIYLSYRNNVSSANSLMSNLVSSNNNAGTNNNSNTNINTNCTSGSPTESELSLNKMNSKSATKRRRGSNNGNNVCLHCGDTSTPEWRRGPYGDGTLCNACGLFYRKIVRRFSAIGANLLMWLRKDRVPSDRRVPLFIEIPGHLISRLCEDSNIDCNFYGIQPPE
ncbi:hypothetical protein TBLA_0B09240 [Henningerozyma blattae CBS 6284]|uniref:GATA-type domain-containing protein n=1 Tax=Henningerozyma blattae (strain ATCC 34711 / CBS 6284 / DSM 70876 / NBRC 10599 / NRRL Y-10934 / UCD 77-7) TaxID=1071380 RepID=I2H039_HENB6|nr:hypothetical protein TBLA_0B09240 [Tetrapisispora blattae CBS 6284]CCH59741.1 hypothetical protein TBLA_0B09240 [Tetrapisispora blattae CBS 6284]